MVSKIDAHDIAIGTETREFSASNQSSNQEAQHSASQRGSSREGQKKFIVPRRQVKTTGAASDTTGHRAPDYYQNLCYLFSAHAGGADRKIDLR